MLHIWRAVNGIGLDDCLLQGVQLGRVSSEDYYRTYPDDFAKFKLHTKIQDGLKCS